MTDNRKTTQFLIPHRKGAGFRDSYDIYPSFDMGGGKIFAGIDSLASAIEGEGKVIIDGYAGVFFREIVGELVSQLSSKGKSVSVFNIENCFRSTKEIDEIIKPFLGGDDPLFGRRATIDLSDLFDSKLLSGVKHDLTADISLIFGPGAALSGAGGLLIYTDLPKNELQYRARAGSVTNLGASSPAGAKEMYKRFYFVDWILLNRHKQNIIGQVDIFADGQRPGSIVWTRGDDARSALAILSHNVFRVRPWFEPGTWGGSWIKEHIEGLSLDVPNYAWSFELIVPENGLLFESDGLLLEMSFDSLMYLEAEAVLGNCYGRFGVEFPIRFDFLDTFDGGNLSVQCHPRPDYTRHHFGEDFTQEESYYILDTRENAKVYLGFNKGIDPGEFREELQKSYREGVEADIDRYVQSFTAKKHDLFLIPYGTIHGSGKNNLVLEISSTPYIFTFKMYDWLRPDLDGKPRPLNIDRAMENLYFERSGEYVAEKLISRPVLIDGGDDWQLFHLPTHKTHIYDVHRYHFNSSVTIETSNRLCVMSLVEGDFIIIETEGGVTQRYHYAETFVVPAAAISFRLLNKSGNTAVVVLAFIKQE